MKSKIINIGLLSLLIVSQSTPLIINATEVSNQMDQGQVAEAPAPTNSEINNNDELSTLESDVNGENVTDALNAGAEPTQNNSADQAVTDGVTDQTITDEAADQTVTDEAADQAVTDEAADQAGNVELNLETATTAADSQNVGLQRTTGGNGEDIDLSNTSKENQTKADNNAGKYELKFKKEATEDTQVADEAQATEDTQATDDAFLVTSQPDVQTRGVQNTSTLKNETNLEVDKQMSTEQVTDVDAQLQSMEGDDLLVGEDGEILAAAESSFMTVGGTDYTTYIYETLDTVGDQTTARPINGGAQDGKYLETVEYNGNYYAHVIIGGFEGYMHIEDVQILPASMNLPESFYTNENGNWVKYVPIDPLTSNEYQTYTIDQAPSWAAAGVKYYTSDDETFYNDTIGNSRGVAKGNTTQSYFQNLPFRSTADYSGADYKKYLSTKGYTNSMYYNATNAFEQAEEYYGINSLYLFAWANHEGAYGTSQLSQQCNNFFGMGAYDSDPGNACRQYGWDTATDGILAEADIVTSGYGDVNDWRFYGTEPGNKNHGINAKYASDPNWGNKMASHMYEIDKSLGSKEINKYRIYALDTSEQVYNNSGLTSKLQQQGFGTPGYYNGNKATDFKMVRRTNTDYGQTKAGSPRVVVTAETSNAFEYQLNTPVHLGSSGYVQFWLGNRGTYPNFGPSYGGKGQTYENYVKHGYSNSNALYGTDWQQQQKWYPKTSSYGTPSYSVVNDVPVKSPSLNKGGDTGTRTDYFYNSDGTLREARKYVDNKLTYVYTYYSGTIKGQNHGSHIKTKYQIKDGYYVNNAYTYQNNTKKLMYSYNYYGKPKFGQHGSHVRNRYDYNSDGTVKSASLWADNKGGALKRYTYYPGAIYGKNQSTKIKNTYYLSGGKYIRYTDQYYENTKTKYKRYYYDANTVYGHHAGHISNIVYY